MLYCHEHQPVVPSAEIKLPHFTSGMGMCSNLSSCSLCTAVPKCLLAKRMLFATFACLFSPFGICQNVTRIYVNWGAKMLPWQSESFTLQLFDIYTPFIVVLLLKILFKTCVSNKHMMRCSIFLLLHERKRKWNLNIFIATLDYAYKGQNKTWIAL